MTIRRKRVVRTMSLLGALFAVASFGESRLVESHAPAMPIPSMLSNSNGALSTRVASNAVGRVMVGADDDGATLDAQTPDDDALLVPAVFVRDPDVRIVYYRHVSKWM